MVYTVQIVFPSSVSKYSKSSLLQQLIIRKLYIKLRYRLALNSVCDSVWCASLTIFHPTPKNCILFVASSIPKAGTTHPQPDTWERTKEDSAIFTLWLTFCNNSLKDLHERSLFSSLCPSVFQQPPSYATDLFSDCISKHLSVKFR